MNRTKEDFMAKWADELSGLLLAAFAEEKKGTDFSRDGRFMVVQLRRARSLLERMYDDLARQETPLKVVSPPKR
jgi:hypothetical protein